MTGTLFTSRVLESGHSCPPPPDILVRRQKSLRLQGAPVQAVGQECPSAADKNVRSPLFRPFIASLVCSLLLAGCSFFSRSQSKVYSIERIPPAAVTNVRGLSIAIDGVELPPGFDRREIVVRKADHQLEVRSAELWSATLAPLVLHTLAFDLADRLPEGMVVLPGAARPAGAIRSIDVVVEEIAAGPEAKIFLDTRWIVRESGRAGVSHHERLAIDIPALDSTSIATGMSQALAALADRIAAGLS